MPTTTPINPNTSLRGQQITPDPVNAQVTPGQVSYTPVASINPVAAQQLSAIGNQIDPNTGQATAQSAAAGNRLSHNINTQSVMRNAMNAFNSQLPQMNIDFADQSDALAKKTAAMGRTGSGLFNRDTGYISDRARAAREGLLGNLSFTAAQTDAANQLQAAIQSAQLREAQEGRFANVNVANMQSANQLAGANAGNALRAALSNQDVASRIMMANASNDLQAQLANQGTALDLGKFNAAQNLGAQQFNVGNDLTAQLNNVQNLIRNREFDAGFMADQQRYQDSLARQAQQDLYNQMMLFQQGFQGDPTGTIMNAGGNIANMAQLYGNNAAQTNQGIGQGVQGLLQMLMMGGGSAPQGPTGVAPQLPQLNLPTNLFDGQFPGAVSPNYLRNPNVRMAEGMGA